MALAAVRLTFGTLALAAPRLLVRRVQGDGPASPAAVYAFRMFGVRTVVLAGHLLAADPGVRRRAVVEAPFVHAADALTAAVLTARRQVSPASGLGMVGVSLLNTALAVAARPISDSPDQ